MARRIPRFDELMAVSQSRGALSEAPELWDGLVGWWPFQEGAGGTAYDLSGYGQDAQMSVGMGWSVDTYWRCATNTDGNYATVGTHPPSDGLGSIALTIWLKLGSQVDSYPNIISRGQFSSAPYNLHLDYSQRYCWRINTDAGRSVDIGAASGSNWEHVLADYDGAGIRLYVNGSLKASDTFTGTIISGDTVRLLGASANQYVGKAVLAGIYSKSLKPAEIQQLYEDPWAMGRLRPRVFRVASVQAAGLTFNPAWAMNVNSYIGLGR